MSSPSRDALYNPLDEDNLARSVADEVERQPVHNLPPAPFGGAGVYALYYVGDHDLYLALSRITGEAAGPDDNGVGPSAIPIYVGKAAAGGSRHGNVTDLAKKTLYSRIQKHQRSIESVSSLSLADFRVRYLRVRDVWIPLAEQGLLQRHTPLWNKVLDGFGNNPPGAGRDNQRRSTWDTIHPGRKSADGRPVNSESVASIRSRIKIALDAITSQLPMPESALGAVTDDDE